ncbi:MAG: ribbon-helix-helix domain-containing protein [Alphaproteobacteria bacterium]|nr:ribbon-helix-helix domain-containing protein [Alphaproteobacteria bacterium]
MLKKSVVIAGRHETSISLEKEFFEELNLICREKKLSINQLVTQIDAERETENLSSAIRVYILKQLKEKTAL